MFTILPSLICWHIWKARNKGVFEGKPLHPAAVVQAIFREVKMPLEIQFKSNIRAHTFQQLYDW